MAPDAPRRWRWPDWFAAVVVTILITLPLVMLGLAIDWWRTP